MSWNDLRKGRYSQAHFSYFITFVVKQRKPIFNNFELAHIFCQQINENEITNDCQWLTWLLMPDHFHGILQLNKSPNLAQTIRHLKSNSARLINKKLHDKGALWQQAYFDRALRKDDDIRQIARYIIANPLRANIVDDVRKYPFWDSHYL